MEKISSQELRTRGENLVLERVRGELFEKYLPKKEKYKHVGGSLYNTAKFLFYVFSVWYFLVIILNLFISSLAVERYAAAGNAEKLSLFANDRFMTLACLVLLAASFVLMIKKKRVATCIITFVNIALLAGHIFQITAVYPLNSENDYRTANPNMIVWFYLPVLLMAVFALVILIIELRDARLERAAFEREINKIYSRFSVSGELMSDEKWQQVIEEYENEKSESKGGRGGR